MNLSYWEKAAFSDPDQSVIIGAGLVGLFTAIECKVYNPSRPVLIIDRAPRPYGASTKNAGFACFGSVSEILSDLDKNDEKSVEDIVSMRYQGLQTLFSHVSPSEIDYQECGGYELFLNADEEAFHNCKNKIDWCNDLLERACGLQNTYFLEHTHAIKTSPFPLIKNQHEGALNPEKLVCALIRKAHKLGIRFLWGCKVNAINYDTRRLSIDGNIVMPYDKIAICTNAFTRSLIPDINIVPGRNIVGITNPIPGLEIEGCFHYDEGYIYFRNVGNRLLIGGGRNKWPESETTTTFGEPQEIKDFLTLFIQEKLLPSRSIQMEHWWSGILATADKKEPIIRYDPEKQRVLAVRMGGMGVAISSIVGRKAAKFIMK